MEKQEGKYLTFSLADEEYGVPILKVKEIIGMMDITSIPRTPEFVKGVINLRGKIIPIIDLRLKFGLEEKAYHDRTCIIVVEINTMTAERQMGIVVDMVSEVMNIPKGDIDPPPEFGTQIEGTLLIGMGKVKDKVIILLNMDEILNKDEMVLIKEAKGSALNV